MEKEIPKGIYEQILEYSIIPAVDAVICHYNKILLAKRTQEPCKGKWWIPGGKQNKRESPERAVIRKIKSEIGLDIEVRKMIYVEDVIFDKTAQKTKTGVHYLVRVYLAELKNKNQKIILGYTQKEFMWADKDWFENNRKTCILI